VFPVNLVLSSPHGVGWQEWSRKYEFPKNLNGMDLENFERDGRLKMIKKELMDILACPSCKGDVREEKEHIVCLACGLRYPIRNGIPVMLIDEAKKTEDK
jgi:uncharacterized protein YbaR (Trm112 family)